MKMELTQGSETSANYNLTPGKYPKEYIQYSNHGESLKSRIRHLYGEDIAFENGTDTGFRNIGQLQFDAGEIPKRIYTKKLTLFCSIRYKFTTKIGREKGTNINFAQLFTMYFTNPL